MAISSTKTIRVHYFRVSCLNVETDTGMRIDCGELESLLERLSTLNVMDRRLEAGASYDEIRLQVVKKEKEFWRLQFVKVRSSIIPSKVDSNGGFDEIELEDDEFVGEDVTCLYSPAEHVIAIQRNFYSVSSGKIYDYFGQIGKRLFDEDTTYIFEPMLDSSQRDFKYAVIRSLDFSCVDLNNDNLEDTIKNTGNYFGAKNMVCHLSIESHNRGALSLKKDKIVSLVKNALRHNNMSTLKAKVRKDPDSPVEEIDFLEQRIESSFRLRYSKQQPITHIRIWHEMVKKYPDVLKKIRGQS